MKAMLRIACSCAVFLLALASTAATAQLRFVDQLGASARDSAPSLQDSIRQKIISGQINPGHGPKLKNHGPPPDPSQLLVPHWNGSFRNEGTDYAFTVLGGDPSANETTIIPVVVVPYRFFFADGTVIDATSNLLGGATALETVLESPIFQDHAFQSGPTALGTTQWGDAYMRGNFWSLHGGADSGYHVRLQLVGVAPVVSINVPADLGFALTFGTEKIGFIDYLAMRELTAIVTRSFQVPPSMLAIHVSDEIVSTTPVGGTIFGFHDAVGLSASPDSALNTVIVTSVFSATSVVPNHLHTTTVLAHEVVEWLMDPLLSNAVPMWVDPALSYCWNGLMEVADPLESLAATQVTLNGRTYDLPDVAFLPWFARASTKYSVNGWYSLRNSLPASSQKCPSFFDGYVTFYFPNDVGMDSAQLTGINNSGQASGYFTAFGRVHSFVLGNLQLLDPNPPPISVDAVDVPGSLATFATRINDRGEVVGVWFDAAGREHGFLRSSLGQYDTIDVPGAIATEALGLDNKSNLTIVGDYVDPFGAVHGFTLTAGVFKRIDVPQSVGTVVTAINDANTIVGRFLDAAGHVRGFDGTPGATRPADFPGGGIQLLDTLPAGINSFGHVGGTYVVHSSLLQPDVPFGFLYDSGLFSPVGLANTGEPLPTRINDINDQDYVAGSFVPPGSGPVAAIGIPLKRFLGSLPASATMAVSLPAGLLAPH